MAWTPPSSHCIPGPNLRMEHKSIWFMGKEGQNKKTGEAWSLV